MVLKVGNHYLAICPVVHPDCPGWWTEETYSPGEGQRLVSEHLAVAGISMKPSSVPVIEAQSHTGLTISLNPVVRP